MIARGKTENEFLEELAKLDISTNIDSILTHGQSIHIDCMADQENGFINWTITQDSDNRKEEVLLKGPISRNKFLDELKSHVEQKRSNENIVVLCYGYSEPSRTSEGKIRTQWIVINPAIPFEFIDGMPEFPMLELELTDVEYQLAMESKMALYDECSEDVYIIRQIAFSSIGKLLDSAASFKNMAKIPLGSALLLADRFAVDMKELKLIYRNANGKIKPLIGIAGSRFAQEEETEFYKKAFSSIESMFGAGTRRVFNWCIDDDMTDAYVQLTAPSNGTKTRSEGQMNFLTLSGYDQHFITLRIRTSDIPGVSASVTAFIALGEATVMIQKNSAYHWDAFIKKGGAASLFYRQKGKGQKSDGTISLKQDIDQFLEKLDKMRESEVVFCPSIQEKFCDIIDLIGMRRMDGKEEVAVIKKKCGEKFNAYDLYKEIIDATYVSLPRKQEEELSIQYSELSDVIAAAI